MDNLTHTLVGAVLGQAGLKRRTGLGMAALMIGANLPDIDALGLLVEENLAWRRGWTHGPLALLILPPLLAIALAAYDRWQIRRGTRPAARPPVRFGWLVALSYIGALSHPLLDFLNTYGVRCLMPFSERWFYGDTLFIVDPLVWVALGVGIWLSRRRERRGQNHWTRPAMAALALVVAYGGAMHVAGREAERQVAQHWTHLHRSAPTRVLASPVLLDPFRRQILLEAAGGYAFGDFHWLSQPHLKLEPTVIPTNMSDPAIAGAAADDKAVADFLYWSRFPFARIERLSGATKVTLGDARYNRRPDDSAFSVRTLIIDRASLASQPGGSAPERQRNLDASRP